MSTLAVGTIKSISSAAPVFQNTSGTEKGQLCKAWVNFNGTGTIAIRDSFNVSSITDVSQGTTTITLATAMSNTNYCVGGTAGSANNSGFRILSCYNNLTTTTFTVDSGFHDASPYVFDCEYNAVLVFGDN
tara:strand:+ start:653 stop:1045 length:393 start_codon:yes stop_codon:yes gene_type:complete